MKQRKEASIAVRLDNATRSALHKKVKHEHDHDVSSVMRYLINLYLKNEIKIGESEK